MERTIWAQLIASVIGLVVYLALIVPQLITTPVGEIAWVWPMVGTIAGGIVLSIVLSIASGIVARMRAACSFTPWASPRPTVKGARRRQRRTTGACSRSTGGAAPIGFFM